MRDRQQSVFSVRLSQYRQLAAGNIAYTCAQQLRDSPEDEDTAMAQLVITYWRDIPSQVTVKAGRKAEKKMLSERFQEAIDMAAMRSGAADTDDYLAEWRRADPVDCGDDLEAEAAAAAAKLEAEYDKDRLKQLINNGGRA